MIPQRNISLLSNRLACEGERRIPEIESKMEFRGRSLTGIGEEFARKEARYRKLWNVRLASQMIALPRFDEVYRAVRRVMREAGLMDK